MTQEVLGNRTSWPYSFSHGLRTPNEAFFHQNPKLWADKFWGIWGIIKQFISTHFGTVSPLSMFSINQELFLQKNQAFISKSQICIWD